MHRFCGIRAIPSFAARRLASYAPWPESTSYEVDFLRRAERLVVEVDGFACHSTRAAFERDRRRDAVPQAAGYRVIRFTYMQIVNEPATVTACLATHITI